MDYITTILDTLMKIILSYFGLNMIWFILILLDIKQTYIKGGKEAMNKKIHPTKKHHRKPIGILIKIYEKTLYIIFYPINLTIRLLDYIEENKILE